MTMLACVPCGRWYKVKKNGIRIEEGMPLHGGTWGPYKLWQADLYECTGCGASAATGFGLKPIAEHYQSTYAETVRVMPPLARINE